jgi:uncharacterized protein
MPSPGLLVATIAFLALYVAGPILLYSIPWPSAATLRDHVALANQVYSTGSLAELWRFYWHELPLVLSLHASIFPRTLALFALGAFLWRVGVLTRPHDFRREIDIVWIVGISGGAALTTADAHLAPVLLALGYAAALMALLQRPAARRFLSGFAPIGRMAFTNYLLQSLSFSFIFFGWGLGQFGRMGVTMAFALGITVYVAQMALSNWWLSRYRFGPVEWLWRTLMYGAAQPMRRGNPNR